MRTSIKNWLNKINWTVRFKNPMFWVQIVASVFVPVMAYMGISYEDLTTWHMVGNVLITAVSNPYVLALIVWNIFNTSVDPTTTGISDSANARTYITPNNIKE